MIYQIKNSKKKEAIKIECIQKYINLKLTH